MALFRLGHSIEQFDRLLQQQRRNRGFVQGLSVRSHVIATVSLAIDAQHLRLNAVISPYTDEARSFRLCQETAIFYLLCQVENIRAPPPPMA